MPKISLRALCLVTAVLCNNVQRSLEHEIPRRSFLSRRAIDGTRGRKYFDPSEDGAFDSYGSAGGQYDPYDHVTDLSDIRKNVPGEPGVDYPAYTTLPQTGFTCEGRSRGYYADEVAGCQVFHVCHDVLVSSFLCPIGSTFSQKLLTCDWWTKVDCASSNRYLGVNRNSYQIDDDEMIRNAYAMISLQSSAEDVTKDGLVDPDSGARIIDYSALTAARTMTSYTPGFRRITDYAVVYATGNDLPSGFDDYSRQDNRQVFTYDRYNQQKKENSDAYRGEFRMEEKGRSPYHASPIIRHDYQRENDNFQDDYRRPGFTDQFQVSYAPTVPTVTTTTRRFYSPTVPTTYRSSTLAYNKLDLMMDSSDHLYAHSKSSVSTTTRHDDDTGNAELREHQTKYGEEQRDPSKSDSTSTPRTDEKDDDIASADDQVRGSLDDKSDASFRINVTDAIDEDEVFRQQNERPLPESDYRDSLEDIEIKDSIGIARALSDPADGIIARNQNPVDQPSKSDQRDPTTPIPLRTQPSHSSDSADSFHRVLDKSDAFNGTSNDRSPTTEDYVASTTKSPEETAYTRSLDDKLIATSPRNWQQKDDDVVQSSTTISRPLISTTESSVEIRSSFDQNRTSAESVESTDSDDSDSAFRINLNFQIPQPAQFLQPPLESFLINVPEEARYTAIDESFKATSSAEVARLSSTPPSYNDNSEEESDYNESVPETPSLGIQGGTDRQRGVAITSIPWLASTWRDQPTVNVPVTDIVPPIVDYNDGFGDFVPPREQSRTEESRAEEGANKDNETEILNRYNTGFAFTIRDAIKAQLESRADPPCSSGKQTRFCETTSTDSTPSVREEETSIGIEASPRIPERFFPSDTAESTVSSEFPVSITVKPEDSTLKTVMPRDALRIGDLEEQTEKNVTGVPGGLKQIEQSIDKHNSPHEVSYTIKKKEHDLQPTPDDFVSRLIAPHQRSIINTPAPNDNPNEFEIVKSLETEAADISQLPISHTDNDNSSLFITINDTIDRSKQDESNVSMLSLLQLMAELLKLDRLPRPFSTKDLHNVKNSFNFDEPVTENPSFASANSKTSTSDISKAPESVAPSRIKLLNSDPNLDNPLSVTMNPAFDQSYAGASFGDTKTPSSDVSKTSVNVARPKTPLNSNKASSITTDSSLLDYSPSRISFGEVSNSKTPTHFDTSRVPFDIARSRTSSSLDFDKTSFVTVTPLLDYTQSKTPFADPEGLPFDVTSKAPSTFKASKETVTFTKPNPHNASSSPEEKRRSQNNGGRPLQKEEILEQLTENFGQPLYRDDSIRKSLMFSLPQVQRSLEFKSGLPIEKSEHAIDESKRKSSTERAITESTAKTIVETEFVPSLGFSFDTNEGREEYVQAILGGLIDERTGEQPGENESSTARPTDARNATAARLENLKDV